MGARLYVAGALAIVGGFLMAVSGYSSRSLLYTALNIAEPKLSDFISGIALSAAVVAIYILELLISLGGITVLVGGLLIVLNHARTGRILIFLGGGAGFLGLLISFGYTGYKLGLDQTLAYAPYWIGLVMAVVGRRLAKGA